MTECLAWAQGHLELCDRSVYGAVYFCRPKVSVYGKVRPSSWQPHPPPAGATPGRGSAVSDLARDGCSARARVLSAAEQAAKVLRDATARGNLAALLCDLYGVDLAAPDPHALEQAAAEFAELAGALGLNNATTGCRRCGDPISAIRVRNPKYRDGYCTSRCAKLHVLLGEQTATVDRERRELLAAVKAERYPPMEGQPHAQR